MEDNKITAFNFLVEGHIPQNLKGPEPDEIRVNSVQRISGFGSMLLPPFLAPETENYILRELYT